jgi:hypothetical protein
MSIVTAPAGEDSRQATAASQRERAFHEERDMWLILAMGTMTWESEKG